MDTLPALHKYLIAAHNQRNTNEVIAIMKICDEIYHGNNVTVNSITYTANDLPNDAEWQQFVKAYNFKSAYDVVTTDSTVLYMATISKVDNPNDPKNEIKNVICIPKYDGISVAAKFVRNSNGSFVCEIANSRGKDVGNTIVNNSLTDKINELVSHIQISEQDLSALCSYLRQTYSVNISSINEFAMRGELILNYRMLNSDGTSAISSASLAAGAANGKMENFKDQLNKLCLQFYEIGYINGSSSPRIKSEPIQIVPTQIEAINIIKCMNIHYKYTTAASGVLNPQCALVNDVYSFETTTNLDFPQLYEHILQNISYPTDGIVYTSADWRYPQNKEAFGKKSYGKYAWKPDNYHTVNVTGVEWSMSRNGELVPTITFQNFNNGGRNMSRTKSCLSTLTEFIKQGFGINALVSIRVVHGINAYIERIINVDNVISVYVIPDVCPFCSCKLTNNDNIHLMCNNSNCLEQRIQKFSHLIGTVGKIRTLTYYNEKGKEVKSKLAESKLRKIAESSGNILNISIILKYVPNLLNELDNLSHEDQLVALSFGGVRDARNLIANNNSSSWRQYKIDWMK